MLTDTDRRIDQMYKAGLEHIKVLYHFHRPKCLQPGCVKKLSAKDERRGHTLCEICYAAEQKAKHIKKCLSGTQGVRGTPDPVLPPLSPRTHLSCQ